MNDPEHEADVDRWPLDEHAEATRPDDAFVDATVGRILGDPDVQLSVLLCAYRVPAPSPDFVSRTLARVGPLGLPRPTPAPRARPRWPLVLAAAAVILAGSLWWTQPPPASPQRAPAPMASFAAALGQHAARYPRDDAPPLDGFFGAVSFADNDGLFLVAGGQR